MVPFLYQYLKAIYHGLLEKVCSPKVMSSNLTLSQMSDIDLTGDRNLLPAKSIPLNFATKNALRDAELDNQEEIRLKTDIKTMYVAATNKLNERSSVKSNLLLGNIECLSPVIISTRSTNSLTKKLEGLLLEIT